MKMYIAHCFYNGNRVVKFRTQAEENIEEEQLKPIAKAIAYNFTGHIPNDVKFVLCPIQV